MVEGAKRLLGRSSDVAARVEGLRAAAEAARGRLDDGLVEEVAAVAERAGQRLRLSAEHTVVAIAGSTGSGKSSLFNRLTDLDLAATGVRRPTTSWTMACTWGAEGAGPLLEWLGVPQRHQVSRDSMLDVAREDRDLDGLVLLDLPDHDSTEVSHHVEVDRLVRLADVLVWVLDPQKYADAAVHDRYLAPYADHREIIVVVLNHIDTVPGERREAMLADLRRLLDADGLAGVPVLATSARHGEGVAELRRLVAERVAAKKAMRTRVLADVTGAAARLRGEHADAEPGDVARARREELVDAFAEAAAVPTVVRAVERSTRVRAARATGWPLTSWLGRLRPDPLRRLHLDLGAEGKMLTSVAAGSLPEPTPVQRARVDTAVRAVADDVAAELSAPWAAAVHRASTSRLDDLGDALDAAVSGTDLGVSGTPLWWRLVRGLQWLLLLGAVAGAAWLGLLALLGFLRIPAGEPPTLGGQYGALPVPTALLLGGVAAGVLLGLACRVLVARSARRRARVADRRLRAAIGEVTDRLVVAPIEEEVAAFRRFRDGLRVAAG